MQVKINYPGCIISLSDEEGQRLVGAGYAEIADDTTHEDPAPPKHILDRLARKGCCKHEDRD